MAELTVEHFVQAQGQDFTLHLPDGATLALQLEAATPGPRAYAGIPRHPFSLLFRCAALPRDQYIQQGSYRFEHPRLGQLEIFITPMAPDAKGMSYEAIFS